MKQLVLLALMLTACGPTSTGTVCPDPDPYELTYGNFGKDFMDRYCIGCHDSSLTRSMRNGAPIYHDFDTLLGVRQTLVHIDQQAGFGPEAQNTSMPPDRCPSTPGGSLDKDCDQPTTEEREKLARWVACEKIRAKLPADAGVDVP